MSFNSQQVFNYKFVLKLSIIGFFDNSHVPYNTAKIEICKFVQLAHMKN